MLKVVYLKLIVLVYKCFHHTKLITIITEDESRNIQSFKFPSKHKTENDARSFHYNDASVIGLLGKGHPL